MNPYGALVRQLGRTRGFSWIAARVLPPLDLRFVRRRRSVTSFGTGFSLCYLETVGRRTGELRTVPLLHVRDGERVVLFASNWGKRRHPGWAVNLAAHPEARITIEGHEQAVRARRATSDEEARYWPRADALYPGYAGYRRRAGRQIRVFVLEPSERPADR